MLQIYTYFGPPSQKLPEITSDVEAEVRYVLSLVLAPTGGFSDLESSELAEFRVENSISYKMLGGLLFDMLSSCRKSIHTIDDHTLESCSFSIVWNLSGRLPIPGTVQISQYKTILSPQRLFLALKDAIHKRLVELGKNDFEIASKWVEQERFYNLSPVERLIQLSDLDTCSEKKNEAFDRVQQIKADANAAEIANGTAENRKKIRDELNAARTAFLEAAQAYNEKRKTYGEKEENDLVQEKTR